MSAPIGWQNSAPKIGAGPELVGGPVGLTGPDGLVSVPSTGAVSTTAQSHLAARLSQASLLCKFMQLSGVAAVYLVVSLSLATQCS